MPSDPILQAINLSKRFGDRWAVHDLSLTVARGEIFGFLGPNGAGKSTTIRMLLSLIRPTGGQVRLFGKSLDRHRAEVLARVGGLVERADFYLYLTARQNLGVVAALKGGLQRSAINDALAIVGLTERADDKVKTFSHGMKQRLGIAQALLGNPDFIILDEPTSGLDPIGIKEVRDLIRKLAAEKSITVFLSSHLLSEIEQTATSMAIINAGKLVVQGGVHELLEAQDAVVKIDARPAEAALKIIGEHRLAEEATITGGIVEARMPAANIAPLARLLVEAGIDVHALIPRRSLEEYFLSLTEGASEMDRARH